jgi:hypothetical protein
VHMAEYYREELSRYSKWVQLAHHGLSQWTVRQNCVALVVIHLIMNETYDAAYSSHKIFISLSSKFPFHFSLC